MQILITTFDTIGSVLLLVAVVVSIAFLIPRIRRLIWRS